MPVLTSLPRRNQRAPALCGCKKHGIDTYGDHTATCTAHSGATKVHDWAVGVLGPLFRSAGHIVRTQHQVTASAGHRRGDVEIREYLRDTAGSRSTLPFNHIQCPFIQMTDTHTPPGCVFVCVSVSVCL